MLPRQKRKAPGRSANSKEGEETLPVERRPFEIQRRGLAAGAALAGMIALNTQVIAANLAKPASNIDFTVTEDMSGRIVFITDGNSALGLECAQKLAAAGATVVIGCRDVTKGKAAAAKIRDATESRTSCACLPLDLGSLVSVKQCVKQFLAKYPELNVLINNAHETASTERLLTADKLEKTMGVNYLGQFALSALLLDRLRRSHGGVRVINLSSTAAISEARESLDLFGDLRKYTSPDDDDKECTPYSPRSSFSKSMLANALFSVEMQRRLDEAPVLALNAGASPGLPGGYGAVSVMTANADRGATTSLYLATTPTLPEGARGGYFEEPFQLSSDPAASDGALARALWEASEAATG